MNSSVPTAERRVLFNFANDSDKEEDNISNIKGSEAKEDEGQCSDSEISSNFINNVDIYDKLNFDRIKIKRSSRKGLTDKPKSLIIEKFSDEITKITEDLISVIDHPGSENSGKDKKKTIRFSMFKSTFRYLKDREMVFDGQDADTQDSTEGISIS